MAVMMFVSETARMKYLQTEKGYSYAQIADEYGVNKGIIWKILNEEGYEPQDPEIRRRLGFPQVAEVEFIDRVSLNGRQVQIQAHSIKQCPNCGAWFIPNTAKRDQCFVCVPFRKRI